jgi:hypothetical protein
MHEKVKAHLDDLVHNRPDILEGYRKPNPDWVYTEEEFAEEPDAGALVEEAKREIRAYLDKH